MIDYNLITYTIATILPYITTKKSAGTLKILFVFTLFAVSKTFYLVVNAETQRDDPLSPWRQHCGILESGLNGIRNKPSHLCTSDFNVDHGLHRAL